MAGVATSRQIRKEMEYLADRNGLIPAAIPEGPEKGTYAFPIRDIVAKSQELREAIDEAAERANDAEAALREAIDSERDRAVQREDDIESNARRINAEDNGNGSFTFTNYDNQSKTIATGKRVHSSDSTVKVTENTADYDLSILPIVNVIVDALDLEKDRAKNAETALQTQIANEASRAVAAETNLQGQIDSNASAITAEAARAAAAEAALQTRVSSIENLGDYAGAFNTYALLPKNTSGFSQTVTVNDFATIRADETRGNAVTRYIISSIAPNGDIAWAYDVTYSTDITGKQDKLTAGSNIQISGSNVISATDTIPSNAAVTLQKNGANVDSFTLNQAGAKTINFALSKGDVGLGNVDNTSDLNKPISTAAQAALNAKIDTLNNGAGISITGTGTSRTITNNAPNVQSDWNASTGESAILNKPAIPDISGKVNRAGDTMEGSLNFKNSTLNMMGDDVSIGDQDLSGTLIVRGENANGEILIRDPAQTSGGFPVRTSIDTKWTANGSMNPITKNDLKGDVGEIFTTLNTGLKTGDLIKVVDNNGDIIAPAMIANEYTSVVTGFRRPRLFSIAGTMQQLPVGTVFTHNVSASARPGDTVLFGESQVGIVTEFIAPAQQSVVMVSNNTGISSLISATSSNNAADIDGSGHIYGNTIPGHTLMANLSVKFSTLGSPIQPDSHVFNVSSEYGLQVAFTTSHRLIGIYVTQLGAVGQISLGTGNYSSNVIGLYTAYAIPGNSTCFVSGSFRCDRV